MKIAFVQTYPLYRDLELLSAREWHAVENRDKWMPAILASEGHEVELWGVGNEAVEYRYQRESLGQYPIRIFEVTNRYKKSKKDYSTHLIEYAPNFDADLVILKGVDGGAGIKLLDEYIIPQNKPFIFVIGGKYYNQYIPQAAGIFYETKEQKELLMNPPWYYMHKKVPEEKLFWLPKSIDTELFKPYNSIAKEFDVISAGRLIPRKNHEALGVLSNYLTVALVGDGPLHDEIKSRYPEIELVGSVPNGEISKQLNRGKVFFHTGYGDFFPRVIAEAMASGLPCVAFQNYISEEVLPGNCGIRVQQEDYVEAIYAMVHSGNDKLAEYAENARLFAVHNFGIYSSQKPMQAMLQFLESSRSLNIDMGAEIA